MKKYQLIMMVHLAGVTSFEKNKEYQFDEDEAYRLVNAAIAKCKSEKEHKSLIDAVEAKKEAELQKEKELAAILEKDSLEAERQKLQDRVNGITDILGDGKVYYQSYIDLVK